MAEGWLRALAGDRFAVESAGTKPVGLHPLAVAAMREVGIDISGHQSKDVSRLLGTRFDYVITVCDRARESCPIFPGEFRALHWSLDDPAGASGEEPDRLSVFRRVRDQIEARIRSEFLAQTGR
jgi:arsenate reductase (thioredoxin)